MSRRRCFLHCERKFPLYALPKEDEVKNQWLKFIFTTIPQQYNPNLLLCSLHFTENCFLNRAQFNAGFSRRLVLRDGAVPTLVGKSGESGSQSGSDGGLCGVLTSVRHVASQTDPPERRSVSTQLSMKTLQNSFRSTATQARVPSRDCGVCTVTFPLDSPMLFLQPTLVKRSPKRPRFSITDDEEDPQKCSLSKVVCKEEDLT
ncbi:uncharacterized protein LOC115794460 [Archocentrus centrarchus]|uniref:uncharacterized protein LOC115794460 n=1 Tax=Archocentrus centrarchus TaxID=63155 RepID=UPI0011E9EE33|nr:uncharacterized protein LOC115794460 [Archocentrus centrarchus]